MTLPRFDPSAVELFHYSMLQHRDIFIGKDEDGRMRIWGQTANGGPSTRIELCQVFLEYALYCASSFGAEEAKYQMQFFGEAIGRRLSDFLKQNPILLPSKNAALGALECLFGTIQAEFFEDYAESGARFVVTDCPLEDAAERTGLPNSELARQGVNAMCRSLCTGVNPKVIVNTLPSTRSEMIFTVSTPSEG